MEFVLEKLNELKSVLIDQARKSGDKNLSYTIAEVSTAIQIIDACKNFKHKVSIYQLPQTSTRTPSSEFRMIEDNESDQREFWSEVKDVNGLTIRPLPGSVIIEDLG